MFFKRLSYKCDYNHRTRGAPNSPQLTDSQVVNYESSMETLSNTQLKRYAYNVCIMYLLYAHSSRILETRNSFWNFLSFHRPRIIYFSILNPYVVYICTIVIVLLNRKVGTHVILIDCIDAGPYTLNVFCLTNSVENPPTLTSKTRLYTPHRKIIV